MTHIHVNKELTDDLESQGYHLVDKHQLAKMQALEKVAEIARELVAGEYHVDHPHTRIAQVDYRDVVDLKAALEAMK